MSVEDDVYGITYKQAEEGTRLLENALILQENKGFETVRELEDWAKEHCLDRLLFSNTSHQFLCVSHKGEIMLPAAFKSYYGSILFTMDKTGKKPKREPWCPQGFKYCNKASVNGEQGDGLHQPLYYRDYFVPTGYYSAERNAFNIAKPFPVAAKATGRDTSHIYTYIEHLAGECAIYLLAWLRAKMMYPTMKTQVVPIIVSRAQGSGKTTFAEVICKGLFGKDNVIVSEQYDSTARFNADYADALIVCQEEKEEQDKRNPVGTLKSRATATTIRKEQKGIDPIYQESYTDFIVTTNKDVPLKFDGREDQRRFMIMEADPNFTRKNSKLADEVFTKLYGYDGNFHKVGKGFVEDKDLIAQFKHELFTSEELAKVSVRNFPKTAAYKRCFSLPRTNEATEIEGIMRSIAPFLRASVEQGILVQCLGGRYLSDTISNLGAVMVMPRYKERAGFVALCRPLVFYDLQTNKPFSHSVVERTLIECGSWLKAEYGLAVIPDTEPVLGGFPDIKGRYRKAPTIKLCKIEDIPDVKIPTLNIKSSISAVVPVSKQREGARLRVNDRFEVDPQGCFETVNEMKQGVSSLTNKTANVQYMDTFLFESDETTAQNKEIERRRAIDFCAQYGEDYSIDAEVLYKERLELASKESMKLFEDGKVCRIVYSGAKSYHLLVRVADAPRTLDEYNWLHAYLSVNLTDKLEFDSSTSDPARLTRSPLELERYTSKYGVQIRGKQRLVAENWNNVYEFEWRNLYAQWLSRPLTKLESFRGKHLYPTRTEYKEAAEAISTGQFWSDTKYNGDRQRLFFPAYRLLRALGITHDELWNDIIPSGLKEYVKPLEVNYWKSREHSPIIGMIDSDVDGQQGVSDE